MRRWLALLLYPLASAALAGVWVHEQTLAPGVAGEPEGNDLFGSRIALDGDVLVVGAFSDEIELVPGQGQAGNVGSAYVFRRAGNTWQFEQRLIDGRKGDFGAGRYRFSVRLCHLHPHLRRFAPHPGGC